MATRFPLDTTHAKFFLGMQAFFLGMQKAFLGVQNITPFV
jgi:hypothetical protein